METQKTAEEDKQDPTDKMGERLGSVFQELNTEVADLYIKWGEYVDLYGTKPSRVELLNETAPYFFKLVQDTLWEDTLLHISRLTDPPQYKDRKRLTIRMLGDLITDDTIKGIR